MNRRTGIVALLAALSLALVLIAGCSERAAKPTADPGARSVKPAPTAKILAERQKLAETDRTLVESQEYCVISRERLGSMGPPIKLSIENQPVFLCCAGCREKALADPARTLTQLEEVKARAAREKAGSQQGDRP
jgi:hypothetical protein